MIIVSQERNLTTECLELEIIERDIGFAIYSYGLCEDIGIYKTEERAKEVLREIVKQYEHEKECECDRSHLATLDNFTYRMPKE